MITSLVALSDCISTGENVTAPSAVPVTPTFSAGSSDRAYCAASSKNRW